MKRSLFFPLFGLIIGFYDGFLGPGAGSFWTISLVLLLGLNLKQAVGETKALNFTSNLVALTLFILNRQVFFTAGFVMALGQLIGVWIGTHLAAKYDTKFIKRVLTLVVAATIIKLLLENLGII